MAGSVALSHRRDSNTEPGDRAGGAAEGSCALPLQLDRAALCREIAGGVLRRDSYLRGQPLARLQCSSDRREHLRLEGQLERCRAPLAICLVAGVSLRDLEPRIDTRPFAVTVLASPGITTMNTPRRRNTRCVAAPPRASAGAVAPAGGGDGALAGSSSAITTEPAGPAGTPSTEPSATLKLSLPSATASSTSGTETVALDSRARMRVRRRRRVVRTGLRGPVGGRPGDLCTTIHRRQPADRDDRRAVGLRAGDGRRAELEGTTSSAPSSPSTGPRCRPRRRSPWRA